MPDLSFTPTLACVQKVILLPLLEWILSLKTPQSIGGFCLDATDWTLIPLPVLKLGGLAQINFGEHLLLNILELRKKVK